MSLEVHRKQIDAIDTEIIRLLNERSEIVHEIGVIKKENGLEIYAPEREETLLRSLVAKGEGGRLPEKSIRAIYREIMSAALALEEDLKIAYLGPAGTWTHQAAIGKFGHSVAFLPRQSLSDVFQCVSQGIADYGVVPIENSIEGAARDIYRLFAIHPLQICAEVGVPLEISLLGLPPYDEVRNVYGHPAMLAAARSWLSSRPRLSCIECPNSSEAAETAKADPVGAAIGNRLIAELFGLRELAAKIEDETAVTRFSVVGRKPCPPTGDDLTILTVTGAAMRNNLLELLAVLSEANIETVGIDGHVNADNSGDGNQSIIRAELKGHATVPPLATAIETLRESGKTVTVLGSFPRPVS